MPSPPNLADLHWPQQDSAIQPTVGINPSQQIFMQTHFIEGLGSVIPFRIEALGVFPSNAATRADKTVSSKV